MWLYELVFQGAFGAKKASKLRLDPGFSRLTLPPGVSPQLFRTFLYSLLYAPEVAERDIVKLADQGTQNLRFGAVLHGSKEGERHKLLRKAPRESIQLRAVAQGQEPQTLARGSHEVSEALGRIHNLPPRKIFAALQCWDFQKPRSSRTLESWPSDVQDLVEKYLKTRRLEELDHELDTAHYEQKDARRRFEKIDKLLKKKRGLKKELKELEGRLRCTPKDLEFLEGYDEALLEAEKKHREFEDLIQRAVQARSDARPNPFYKDPFLLGGVVLAILMMILGSALDLRPLALANIGFLGVVAWRLIQLFDKMEAADYQKVRAEQIQRHAEQSLQEKVELEGKLRRILKKTKTRDLKELRDLLRERDDLEQETHDSSQEMSKINARHRRDKIALENAERRVDFLTREKESLGMSTVPTFELEHLLQHKGVDLAELEDMEPESVRPSEERIFARIRDMATSEGLIGNEGISPKVLKTWRGFAVHLFGRKFAELSLLPTGDLDLPEWDEAAWSSWSEQNPGATEILAGMFAGAVLVGASRKPHSADRFLCLHFPHADDAMLARMEKVLHYLGRYAQVLVLELSHNPARQP